MRTPQKLRLWNRPGSHDTPQRQGTFLVLVLVVVALLSFSLYSFSEGMLIQYQAASTSLMQVRSRHAAESGIEAVGAYLADEEIRWRESLIDNPARFREIAFGNDSYSQPRFAVVSGWPARSDEPKFGLQDECSRLNLASLSTAPSDRRESMERLTKLPQVTDAIADSILRWLELARDEGTLAAPERTPKTVVVDRKRRRSIDSLLALPGIDTSLLFGEDVNQNGRLDVGEDVNHDSELHTGLSGFVTLKSAHANIRPDGLPKIDLNTNNLVRLYDELEAEFGSKVAQFVVAFRLRGRANRLRPNRLPSEADRRAERLATADERLRQQLSDTDDQNLAALVRREPIPPRGGLVLVTEPAHRVRSVFDLIGSSVRIEVDGVDSILQSPWRADVAMNDQLLIRLDQTVTTSAGPRQIGRVSIFAAPYEVLMTVPGMSDPLARAIVRRREAEAGSRSQRDYRPRQTLAWLTANGLVDFARLVELAPYLTAQGDVYRGIAVGTIAGSKTQAAVGFTIDGTTMPARVLAVRDYPPMPAKWRSKHEKID